MTEPNSGIVWKQHDSRNDTPAQNQAAMAAFERATIASVTVHLLGLNPGNSEIEWQFNPAGPLAAGGNYPGAPGRKEAFQLFIESAKRELDQSFAWDEQVGP